MKKILIRETDDLFIPDAAEFDLRSMQIKPCLGCWSCWWTTPGHCVFSDMNDFYRAYVGADQAIFILRPEHDFISVKCKALLDRCCPLFMPYIRYTEGKSWHEKRYNSYPDVTIYYEDTFTNSAAKQNFEDYMRYVFIQFSSKNVSVQPLAEYVAEGGKDE